MMRPTPKCIHVLIPGPFEYVTTHGKMGFEDTIKDQDGEFIVEIYNDRRRSEKCDMKRHNLLVLKMEEGVHV